MSAICLHSIVLCGDAINDEKECLHPFCISGQPMPQWFSGGPPVSYIPLPIPDPDLHRGSMSCSKCTSFCSGHFLIPEKAETSHLDPMTQPPSVIIKKAFLELQGESPSDEFIQNWSKQCLLPINEVKMWLNYLSEVKNISFSWSSTGCFNQKTTVQETRTNDSDCVQCGSDIILIMYSQYSSLIHL